MADERSAVIKIGDNEYELLLTTKATKEIAKKNRTWELNPVLYVTAEKHRKKAWYSI